MLNERYGPWALIVGGAGGIGEALALRLAADGVNLILVSRTAAALEETAGRVRAARPVEIRTVAMDIADEDLVERIAAVADGCEIGLVVHNVGGGGGVGPFVGLTLEQALRPVRTNCLALTRLAHAYLPAMAERGRGGLLVLGSMAGNAGSYLFSGYSAAKAWDQIFAEALWAELAPRGVHVLAVPIGAVDTPARRRSGAGVDEAGMLPMPPDELAALALDRLPHGPVHVAPAHAGHFDALCTPDRRAAASLQRDMLLQVMKRAG